MDTANVETLRDGEEVCNTISSLAINGAPESTGVTSFVQEACEAESALSKYYKPSPYNVTPTSFADLKEYFRRPRVISRFPYPTLNGVGDLDVVTGPLIFQTWFPEGLVRLTNVLGVRFKIVLRLQVNTTPFNQGVLCLNWQYASQGALQQRRGETFYMSTQLPHARLDISTSTAAELHIPWMSWLEYMDLSSTTYTYGWWHVVGLVASFAAPTAILPTCVVYAHLEELELIGATPANTSLINLQAGRVFEKEFENDSMPLSSGLYSASRTMSWIAKGIPSLSSLAGPPAWLLGVAAGVARYFGYSRPLVQEPVVRMNAIDGALEQNVDMPTSAQMVGPFAGNHLSVTPTFAGTDVDEMSIDYIKGIYSCIKTGLLKTSDPFRSTLYATNVSPQSFWFRGSTNTNPECNIMPTLYATGTNVGFYPSNVFWLAQFCRYWRGGFRFRVTFAKTKFHAGRVLVTFIPGSRFNINTESYLTGNVPVGIGGVPVAGTELDTSGYSAIWDLKDGNVFEFDCPYVSDSPYLQFTRNIGCLSMSVMDVLLAPSTVATTIQYMVEVKALPDFEVAQPVAPLYPALPRHVAGSFIQAQAGKMISNYPSTPADVCMGEKLTTLKQLIMIPKSDFLGTLAASTTTQWAVLPWWYTNTFSLTGPAPLQHKKGLFAFGGNVAQAYAYVRGSTDVHVYTGAQGSGPLILARLSWFSGNSSNAQLGGNNPGKGTSVCTSRVVQSGPSCAVHVRIPAYQKYVRISPDSIPITDWVPGLTTNALSYPVWSAGPTSYDQSLAITAVSGTSSNTIIMSRQAGDDASAGFYMGPPVLGLINPSPTPSVPYDPDATNLS